MTNVTRKRFCIENIAGKGNRTTTYLASLMDNTHRAINRL